MHRPVQKSVMDGNDTAKTISPIIFWHGIVNRGVKEWVIGVTCIE